VTPRRGDVYDARFDPVEGSEQAGRRPVVVVSRDSMNEVLDRVIVVPCTTHRSANLYPSRVLVHPPEGGLAVPSVVLCEQVRVLSTSRLLRWRGAVSHATMRRIDRALAISLDLPYDPDLDQDDP
jgi:mRNA interferase MazF